MTTKLSFSELLKRAKSEKIAIHTATEAQAKKLLKALYKREYEWFSGEKLTDITRYKYYRENTCYSFHDSHGKLLNKKVMYGPLEYYQAHDYTIIELKDIDFKE